MPDIVSKFVYGGTTDYGYNREVNEDFLAFAVLRDDILLAVIADGAGSRQCGFSIQPAVIAASDIIESVKRMYATNPEMVINYPIETLHEAVMAANRTIGVFKVANEDLYSGFGVCISCCLVIGDRYHIAHCGNTRVYLIRHLADGAARIIQLTNDHTVASRMVNEGTLSPEEYYQHPARNTYTSGLGFSAAPVLQTFSGAYKVGDLLVMTTDGIHYAIRPEFISRIVLEGGDWENSTKALIEGAKQQKMEDNMSAAVIFNPPEESHE